jgi:hypothetical protein
MIDQNDSMRALSTLEATPPIDPSRPACAPRSVWTMVPGSGRRRLRAMSRASTTISVVIRSEIDQPTIRRLNASITAAQ